MRHLRNAILLIAALVLTIGLLAARSRGGATGPAAMDAFPPEQATSTETAPAEPLISPPVLERILAPVKGEVERQAFAGAGVAVGIGQRESHLAGIGAIGWTRNAPPVDPSSTLYDLASVTKVVATASAVLLLVDEGRLDLDDPVHNYLPEFGEGPKAAVTIRHLLTHTSGLPAGATLAGDTRQERIARAKRFPIAPPAGGQVEYSDVGYILLWEAAEVAAGEPLPGYLERKLYRPLGMNDTRFSPGLDCEACAPTGRLRDQSLYRGRPFDPLGQRLDGVGGNTGLFSTAGDLGRFLAMIANGGELDSVRVMSEAAVREFLSPQRLPGPYRLGWELICPDPVEPEEVCAEPLALGHTGWTGTAIYLDPASGGWLALLTNRTYEPRASNRIQEVRKEVLTTLLAATK